MQNTGVEGVRLSAARFVESNGDTSVYLALTNDQGELRIARRIFDGTNTNFVYEEYDSTATVSGRPDILSYNGRLHVVWRTANNEVWTMTKISGGAWTTPSVISDMSGLAITTGISPTLAYAPSAGLHMLRTRSNDTLDLLLFNDATGTWGDADPKYDISDGLYETVHEAQMVWFQGFTHEEEGPGHWQIVFRNSGKVWMAATVGSSQDRKIFWGSSRSDAPLELLYMPDHDNIVGVYGNQGSINFYPFADGVVDAEIKDNNDFISMSNSICFGYREGLPGDSRPCGRLGSVNTLVSHQYYTGSCDGY